MGTLDRHFVVTDAHVGRAARAAFVAWHHLPLGLLVGVATIAVAGRVRRGVR